MLFKNGNNIVAKGIFTVSAAAGEHNIRYKKIGLYRLIMHHLFLAFQK